jgi:hypothetical protein
MSMRNVLAGSAICVSAAVLPSYADSITVAPVVDANGLETEFNLTLDVSATRYLCALAAATGPVVVFCHQRLDGTGSYFVKNAAEVRRIIEKSCKVIGVFAGHEHAGGRNCMNGVSYYTLRSLAESGKCFEVGCYPCGVSVFGI